MSESLCGVRMDLSIALWSWERIVRTGGQGLGRVERKGSVVVVVSVFDLRRVVMFVNEERLRLGV